MKGRNAGFTPGPWYGIWHPTNPPQYLARVYPVRWTLYPEDAWMAPDVPTVLTWLKTVRRTVRRSTVFRCRVERSPQGFLSVIGHQTVQRRH